MRLRKASDQSFFRHTDVTPIERRATASLALIYIFRMLGLFLVLPVFALYANDLEGATAVKVGLALGAYGLTQALLQIPFGLVSDRIGRKPVIVFGLCLFALGSLLAALSEDIHWIIAGRALQGAGAIAAVVSAFLADLTRESVRTKAMLMLGISIGASFALSLILGPVLNNWIGVPGIFMLTAFLGLVAIPVIIWVAPAAPEPLVTGDHFLVSLKRVLKDVNLLRLDLGIFLLHAILTASFLAVPLALRDEAGMATSGHWKIYLPVMLVSLFGTMPLIHMAERRGHFKAVFLIAIGLLGTSLLLMGWGFHQLSVLVTGLFMFFAAFNMLEASLPSLVSRLAPVADRGAALGFYSSSQFMGAFFGGLTGGVFLGEYGLAGVFCFCAGLSLVWLMFAFRLATPPPRETVNLAGD